MLSRLSLRSLALASVLCVGLASAGAQAAQIVSRFGSQDGFGSGVASGDSFAFFDLIAPTPEGTDDYVFGGFSATLGASWSGNITSARVEVFSGGWGLGGNARFLLNGFDIGSLSFGDSGGTGFDSAHLDTFNLSSADLARLGSSNPFEVRLADPLNDGGVLGYVKLILQTDTGGPTPVPEPASLFLVGAALAAALAARRRRV